MIILGKTFSPFEGKVIAVAVDDSNRTWKVVPENDPRYAKCMACEFSFDGFVKPRNA